MKAKYTYTQITARIPVDTKYSDELVAADLRQAYPTLTGDVVVIRENRTDQRVELTASDGTTRAYTAAGLGPH